MKHLLGPSLILCFLGIFVPATPVIAGVGDPQIRTDHPWYPGELALSTFDRLAKTQAELYQRVTGRTVESDEDKALASWFWRNTHFAHGEEGRADLFGEGFEKSDWNRDYWHGLFAHGFALCGTTHAQWTAEMNALLGHCRSRAVGVTGHNSFEVFLKGGAYGEGRWALLDHDLSIVVFDENGTRLLSIEELIPDLKRLGDPDYRSERQRGWRIAGLHPSDINAFKSFRVAEYLAGYAGPPPMVHLRTGETLRRYLEPGLEDGKTFVFWGRNYNTDGIPGPERSRTWVNQPEEMFQAERDAGHVNGQVRYGNAVYLYRPNFADGSYREGIIDETVREVMFEFRTPYVIGATPPDDSDWGVYRDGCRNGLILKSRVNFPVRISTDQGDNWSDPTGFGPASKGVRSIDLTDLVKGHQQYRLLLGAGASVLENADLEIRTVCQVNSATIPRLRDGENRITYQASGRALSSSGIKLNPQLASIVEGTNRPVLSLQPPRGARAVGVYAAAHNLSGSPPNPEIAYRIDYSIDKGRNWQPVVEDWQIERRGSEPGDFWSQSFTYGSTRLEPTTETVFVKFSNDGGKKYRRIETHLAYEVEHPSPLKATFGWTEGETPELKTASHTYPADATQPDPSWSIQTGKSVTTRWVEMSAE